MGNREAKELTCTTHGYGAGMAGALGVCRAEGGQRGGKKWENCNSIISKIYLKTTTRTITSLLYFQFCIQWLWGGNLLTHKIFIWKSYKCFRYRVLAK